MHLRIFIILACIAIFTGCKSSPRNADCRPDWLAPSAKIIFTSRWEDGFLGDADFKLKAITTQTEFDSAMRHLGLVPYADVPMSSYTNEPPQWMGDSDKRWDVGWELDNTFILKQGRWWQIAKYQNGFLYYQSVRY